MAHFAELDKNNVVVRVIVIGNKECMKDDFVDSFLATSGKEIAVASEWEDEAKGIAFCENLLGGRWIQTSYNANFRKRYAGLGFSYSADLDAFIMPRPYPSWTLDKVGDWRPPSAMPDDGEYSWDEKAGEWVELIDDSLSIA